MVDVWRCKPVDSAQLRLRTAQIFTLVWLIILVGLLSACDSSESDSPRATTAGTSNPTVETEAGSPPREVATLAPVPAQVKDQVFREMHYLTDGETLAFLGHMEDKSTGRSTDKVFFLKDGELEAQEIATYDGPIYSFAVSPDGLNIAYFTAFDGVLVSNVSGQQQGAQIPGVTGCLSWSKNSKGLLLAEDDSVSLVNVSDRSTETLFEGETLRCALYSPDGESIAFLRTPPSGGFAALYVSDVDGGNARNISGDEVRTIARFEWSPNGKYIAYQNSLVELADNSTICVASVDGADGSKCITLVPQDHKAYLEFEWSPDSTKLALINWGAGDTRLPHNVEVVSIDDMQPTVLTNFTNFNAQSVTWSATGDQIVFSGIRASSASANSWTTSSSIYTMSTEGENLRPIWGEDMNAVSVATDEFEYVLDDTTALVFNRPYKWYFIRPVEVSLVFDPSVAAQEGGRLPFEPSFAISAGNESISSEYLASLGALSPQDVLRAIVNSTAMSTLLRPVGNGVNSDAITETTFGDNAAAQVTFQTTDGEEILLTALAVDDFPVVVRVRYAPKQKEQVAALVNAMATSMKYTTR